jgi:hypothetical protein
MELVRKSEHPTGKFTNFFLAFPSHEKILPTRAEVEAMKEGVSPMSDHQVASPKRCPEKQSPGDDDF